MPRRCVCEHASESGPSTHRATKHLSACVHSELRHTTKRYKKWKVRPVLGTRRLIIVDDEADVLIELQQRQE
jgi:hypothetical protein